MSVCDENGDMLLITHMV